MKQTSFYPSKVWTFAIWVSSLIYFIYRTIEPPKAFEIFFHFFVLYVPLFPLYFVFIFLSHLVIRQNITDGEKKFVISIIAILLSFIIGKINDSFFDLSIYSGLSFLVAIMVGIWFYKIDKIPEHEPSREDILDDNFHIPKY